MLAARFLGHRAINLLAGGMEPEKTKNGNRNKAIWIEVAVGTAVGVGIALARRKRDPWASARAVTKRVANRSEEISEIAREMLKQAKTIYGENRRIAKNGSELWSQERKMVGY